MSDVLTQSGKTVTQKECRSVPKPAYDLKRALRLLNIVYWIGYPQQTLSWGAIAMTQLAKLSNMTPFGFGILGSLTFYGQFSQILSSFLVERLGHRKLFYVIPGFLYGFLLFASAFIPILVSESWSWVALLVLLGAAFFSWYMINPPMNSWFGDLIPTRIAGRFFSKRMQIAYVIGLISMFAVGKILDVAEGNGAATLKIVTICCFAFGGIIAMIEYGASSLIPEPPTHTKNEKTSIFRILYLPFTNKDFVFLASYNAVLRVSFMLTIQFAFLYLIDVAKMSNLKVMMLMSTAPTIIFSLFAPFWGRMVDRIGYKPVLIGATFLFTAQSLWFLLVTPNSWVLGAIIGILGFGVFPAIETSVCVYMFKISRADAETNIPRTAYTAVLGISQSLLGVAAGFVFGAVASYLGERWSAQVLGFNLTYHCIIFVIAAAMRLFSTLILLGLKPNKNLTIKQVIKQAWRQVHEDFAKLVVFPKRAFSTCFAK